LGSKRSIAFLRCARALSVMHAELPCAPVPCQERRNSNGPTTRGTFHEIVHPWHSLYSLRPSSSGNGDGAAYGIEVTQFFMASIFARSASRRRRHRFSGFRSVAHGVSSMPTAEARHCGRRRRLLIR
jgi:hypothetical protein